MQKSHIFGDPTGTRPRVNTGGFPSDRCVLRLHMWMRSMGTRLKLHIPDTHGVPPVQLLGRHYRSTCTPARVHTSDTPDALRRLRLCTWCRHPTGTRLRGHTSDSPTSHVLQRGSRCRCPMDTRSRGHTSDIRGGRCLQRQCMYIHPRNTRAHGHTSDTPGGR
jgi:hypothetical protein